MKKRITEDFSNRYKDSHYYLTTAVLPGKTNINNLREKNDNHSSYFYVDQDAVNIETTDPNIVTNKQIIPIEDTKNCEKYQPYMYDKLELVTLYGKKFYRDWRYPERPIEIGFSINPKKYCEENPQVYPSFKYISKW